MTYTDNLRLFFQGDKEKAKLHVREARRLAFLLLRQTADTGVKSARRRWTAADGTTIEVIIAGLEVTAIINVPLPEEKEPEPIDDFVVFARTTGLPDGIDVDHPEQILRPPGEDRPWTTFFYSPDIVGFDTFPGRKGTYRTNRGIELFPEGVRHAGNIDWRSADGARISWYGPESRYWYDTYRQPSGQYGKFVFHMGQVLLDVEQYQIDNAEVFPWDEELVVGAAIRQHEDGVRWLYVMLAEMPDISLPPYEVPPSTVYFSENYPMYQVNFALRRFRLHRDLEEEVLSKQWSIVAGSMEVLWFASGWRMCNPWVFNQDGSKLTTFALPDSPLFAFSESDSSVLANTPPEYCDRLDVMVDDLGSVTFEVTSTSMPPFSGRALAAIDYNDEGQEVGVYIGREPFEGSTYAVHLYLGETRYPLWYLSNNVPAGFTQKSVRRRIINTDARADVAVFSTYTLAVNEDTSGTFYENVLFEIASKGQFLVSTEEASNSGPSGGWDLYIGTLESCKEATLAPIGWLWMLHGVASIAVMRASLMGLAISNNAIPYPIAQTFGQFGARGAGSSGPATEVSTLAQDTFNNNTPDLHDHRISSSTAARNGVIVASVRNPGQDFLSGSLASLTYTYATGSTLSALTGVSGPQARYHLVWLLGQPIATP